MPKTAHSFKFSDPGLPPLEAAQKIWRALENLGVKSGGAYSVSRYSPDGSNLVSVGRHNGLPRDALPTVKEASHAYNSLTYSLWIDTMELLLGVDTHRGTQEISLVFVGNALKVPGKHWLARAAEAIIEALKVDTVLLLEAGDEETEADQRGAAGTSVAMLAVERLRGQSVLGLPSLVVMHPDAVPPDLYDEARDAGVRVGTMPSGAVMFSTIHD